MISKPQQDPISEKKYAAAGKAKAFLRTKCAQQTAIACSAKSDWTLTVSDNDQSIVIGSVEHSGIVQWDAEGCQEAFHCTYVEITQVFAAFRV